MDLLTIVTKQESFLDLYHNERDMAYLSPMCSAFDDDLDPLAPRLAPHYSLSLNTCKRDQNTTTRENIAYAFQYKLYNISRSIVLIKPS